MNRRLFFGSLLGVGAATTVQVNAERPSEPIHDGDVLVLEHPGCVSQEGIRNIYESAKWAIPGVKVLVLEEGMKARLLRPEAAEALQRQGL
jgi:hypothetical protein